MKKNLRQLNAIKEWLDAEQQPAYRYAQILKAWYTVSGWEQVTTLSKDLRQTLADRFSWFSYTDTKVYTSKKDGTKKGLLTLADGLQIETVSMPNARDGRTICISSQVGCAMACTFCATGTMGLQRNLTVDEIVDQVRFWRFAGDDITNIVFMGMGEPLANSIAVKEAATLFIENMEIGPTRITISTVGTPSGLAQILRDDFPPVRIALSLHAGTDQTREKLVPTHKGRKMEQIVEWVKEYIALKGNRRHHLTLEYVMLLDQNDSQEEALALVQQLRQFGSHVKLNLIPWNHTDSDLQQSSIERIEKFADITTAAGIATTIRYSKGLDIDAACGQLAVKSKKTTEEAE